MLPIDKTQVLVLTNHAFVEVVVGLLVFKPRPMLEIVVAFDVFPSFILRKDSLNYSSCDIIKRILERILIWSLIESYSLSEIDRSARLSKPNVLVGKQLFLVLGKPKQRN